MRWKDEVRLLVAQARSKHAERLQACGDSAVLSSASASVSSARPGAEARPPPSAGDEDPDTDDDIANMAPKGQPPSSADYRVAARYIASRADWDAIPSNSARWVAFAQQVRRRSCQGMGCGWLTRRGS